MKSKYFPILLLGICILPVNLLAQTEWAFSLPGGGFNGSIGFSVATDQSDNVYSTGQYQDSIDLDPGTGVLMESSAGSTDLYIQKLDPNGNLIWVQSFGSFGTDSGTSIAIDSSNNVYLTGAFSGTVDFDPGANVENVTSNGGIDVFILKLDGNGDFIWVKSFGGPSNDLPTAITLDGLGNLYTVGYFSGQFNDTIDFNPNAGEENFICAGSSDMFVQKLDVTGNFVWAKAIGGSGFDRAYGITVDNNNNPIITGYFESTVDFDPNAGTSNLSSSGSRDIHITKLSTSGDLVWAKSVGSSDFDGGFELVSDDNNDLYVTGFFQGTVDFDPSSGIEYEYSEGDQDIFVLKLSESGDFDWARSYGSSDGDYGRDIAIDNANNIFVTGYFSSSANFGLASGSLISAGATDVFVQKIDPLGNSLLANSFGGSGDDHGVSLTTTSSGEILATGYFQVNADFDASAGALTLSALDYQEIFIAKLSLIDFLGIDPILDESEVSISPNPNNGSFNLIIRNKKLSDFAGIEVVNQLGQSVWMNDEVKQFQQIDLVNKISGMYFVKITSDKGVYVQKLIVN